jgi:hypothetical protein
MNWSYHIHKYNSLENKTNKNPGDWEETPAAEIAHFRPESSDHRPRTQVKIRYDDKNIHVLFRVDDRYIRSVHTRYNSKVNEDSCVEWFVQPPDAEGYYNFEINAGGVLHVNYIVDPRKDEKGKRRDVRNIPEDHARQISISSSLQGIVDPEIREQMTWYVRLTVPFTFFDLHTPVSTIDHTIWRGNLYKCGDKTSHPHWASWAPVGELNFHRPEDFGEFIFSGKKQKR